MLRRAVAIALVALLLAYLAVLLPLRLDDMPPPPAAASSLVNKLLSPALKLRLTSLSPAFSNRYNSSSRAVPQSSRPTNNLNTQYHFSTTARNMGSESFLEAVANRRSIYPLTKASTIPDSKIKEIVEAAAKHVPSSFNSQSTRLVVLVKEEHDKFWDVVTTILKAHVPESQWEHTGGRMKMFAGAYGTILFYEDPEPVKNLQSKFPQYADKFPAWSEHTSAMHQYVLWTALEAEGLGANLQHYNPLPDQKASEIWDVPLEWSLKAQLVFGTPAEGAREKLTEKPVEPSLDKKVKFYGA